MKRYHVITRTIGSSEHLNFEELLPASCTNITGVFVTSFGKKTVELTDYEELLPFPHGILTELANEDLTALFYTYLRSRPTKEIAQVYFDEEMLPLFSDILSSVIYGGLSLADQLLVQVNIQDALEGNNDFQGVSDYLFSDVAIYNSPLDNDDYISLIINATIQYLYNVRDNVFTHTSQHYVQPKDAEVGNATLMINGNNFLLRDYAVVANRKLRPIAKEVIELNEPLDVNSSLKVVFKNTTENPDVTDDLTVKIYIQYEYK